MVQKSFIQLRNKAMSNFLLKVREASAAETRIVHYWYDKSMKIPQVELVEIEVLVPVDLRSGLRGINNRSVHYSIFCLQYLVVIKQENS